jgi:magnesium transporter
MAMPKVKKEKKVVVPEVVEEEEPLHIETVTFKELSWVNIEQPTRRETDYLAQTYSFNQLDLDDCLSRRQRPKVDEYETYLFAVLQFPKWHKEVQIARPSQLAMFIGKNYVVTVHAGELTPLVNFFDLCRDDPAMRQRAMSKGSALLAYRIIDLLVDYCFPIMDKILGQMEIAEDRVFDATVEATHELAVVRRDIIAQRRIIWPLRAVIAELEPKLKKFTTRNMSDLFGDMLDHLAKIWDTLEECKEVIEVYKDSDYVLSTERINRIMRVLTIFSAIILPFVVISSIYGMNVYLPGGLTIGSFQTFLLLLLFMMLVAGGMLFFFRRKHWI